MKDYGWIAWAVALVLIVAFGVWFRVAAPCSWMGAMPAKDVPGRCLTFVRN